MECPRCKLKMEGDPPTFEYWCEKCGDITIEEMHKYWDKMGEICYTHTEPGGGA